MELSNLLYLVFHGIDTLFLMYSFNQSRSLEQWNHFNKVFSTKKWLNMKLKNKTFSLSLIHIPMEALVALKAWDFSLFIYK